MKKIITKIVFVIVLLILILTVFSTIDITTNSFKNEKELIDSGNCPKIEEGFKINKNNNNTYNLNYKTTIGSVPNGCEKHVAP